jgi:phosphoribosylanthranilate isomerase
MQVKICGLKDPDNIRAAIEAGADFIGLVFYPPSPRAITPDAASLLVKPIPQTVQKVGLFVNPSDEDIKIAIDRAKLDMIQLHGAETPERVHDIAVLSGLPVIKAIRIGTDEDLREIPDYENVADWPLFDSRSPMAASLPGGTGHVFDWSILAGKSFKKPWMLSGGLTSQNVKSAISLLNPVAVDVSSGVERTQGDKDAALIKNFIETVKIV